MAKVSGPLMSMEASGTLAGAITFSKWKGRPYVRARVTPHNPRSSAQVGVRSNMAGLVHLYQANKALLDAAFMDRAKQRSISAFNAFTGAMQTRRSENLYAAQDPAPTNAAPANNATALAAAVANKYVTLTWADAVAADAWAFEIYRALAADPTGLLTEQIALIKRGAQVFTDGPLIAGTWHYVIRAISTNGGGTVVSAAVTAIVA